MTIGYSPVRIEKIKEAKKILEIINMGEIQKSKYKPPTMMQKLYDLFIDGRDTLEDGLSIKELALILYPNLVTVDEMFKGKYHNHATYSTIKNTYKNLSRFRKWKKREDIILYSRQTPSGKWLYYNIQDEKEFEEVELRMAKMVLGIQKYMNRAEDILEMKPEERQRKQEQFEEKLRQKHKKKMMQERTWDGKSKYSEIDFTGVNLKESLDKNNSEDSED